MITLTVYKAGTKVGDIKNFDRSEKCTFECPNHKEQGQWRSKDPFVSSWFPADETAIHWAESLGKRLCEDATGFFVLTQDYEA